MERVKRRLLQKLLPSTIAARHIEYSLLLSADDDKSPPSERLLDVALRAAAAARRTELSDIAKRGVEESDAHLISIWPGEHYRLLAGLVEVLNPRLIVEIGTYTGLSALALKSRLSQGGRIVTFDILPWRTFDRTVFTNSDFADGRLEQVIDDLSEVAVAERHHDLLAEADLIFVDAPKDGLTEPRLLRNFESIDLRREPIIVFDNIRLWNMIGVWREIDRPKLDLTSFGHWSGTGLVDWAE